MIASPMTLTGWVVGMAFALLAGRRILLAAAALSPPKPKKPDCELPEVVLLAPMRNETARMDALLGALPGLRYPAGRLRIILGDDASTDGTAERLESWAAGRGCVTVWRESEPVGKGELLNRMLAAAGGSADLVAVYDAKHAPAPDALLLLAKAMCGSPAPGAVGGCMEPRNANASLVALYAALECWVTQLTQHAGKEARGLSSPTTGGNCVYRRAVLEEIGGFPAGSYSEDTAVSLAMQARGYRTRFVEEARATTQMVETVSDFWSQRVRWNLGLYGAMPQAKGTEGWATVLGYADRLVLLAGIALALAGMMPIWVLACYGLAPGTMVLVAIHKAQAWGQLPWLPLAVLTMFPVDVAVTLYALWAKRPKWRSAT
jgi:cellulose synthase/poly-beta-1,6-N-acetylglucosamine synthase-like glycosyltransferase